METDSAERDFLESGVYNKKEKKEDKDENENEDEEENENPDDLSQLSEEEENYYKKLKQKELKGVSEKIKKFLSKTRGLSHIKNKVVRNELYKKRLLLKKNVENKARRIRRDES